MLDMLEKEVNKLNLFEGNIPEITKAVADSIPSKTIPYRMKLALAMSEIMLFISQFRINIKHWNGSSIPINSIMFLECLVELNNNEKILFSFSISNKNIINTKI